MEQLLEDFKVTYAALKELKEKVAVQHKELGIGIIECTEEKAALKAERKGVKKIKEVLVYEAGVDEKALANRRASASLATQQEEVDIVCADKQKKADAFLAEAKEIRNDVDAERARLRKEVKAMEKAKARYKKDVLEVLGTNKK